MAKKSFKDIQGAAAMFITTETEPQEPRQIVVTTTPVEQEPVTVSIRSAEPAAPATGTVTPPQGYRVNHAVIETKSKRVQLLMQPTLHARIKAAADAQGLSFNDLVHRILEDAVKE